MKKLSISLLVMSVLFSPPRAVVASSEAAPVVFEMPDLSDLRAARDHFVAHIYGLCEALEMSHIACLKERGLFSGKRQYDITKVSLRVGSPEIALRYYPEPASLHKVVQEHPMPTKEHFNNLFDQLGRLSRSDFEERYLRHYQALTGRTMTTEERQNITKGPENTDSLLALFEQIQSDLSTCIAQGLRGELSDSMKLQIHFVFCHYMVILQQLIQWIDITLLPKDMTAEQIASMRAEMVEDAKAVVGRHKEALGEECIETLVAAGRKDRAEYASDGH